MVSRKQEMELSKEEMELFLNSPVIRSKKLSLRNFPYLVYCFQTVFQKQEMDLSKEEMELFLPFPVIGSKTSVTKVSPFGTTILKWFTETGNVII